MAPHGGGVVVNMSSICGLEGCTGHPHYSAAKAAILGFTKAAGKELIVQGIRVNAVAPGVIRTDFSRLLTETPEIHDRVVATTSLGRVGEAGEVAGAIVYLASEAASYVTGSVLVVDGGTTI
jgi:3-oxoacyl-[acyl-carrier protein] reductase